MSAKTRAPKTSAPLNTTVLVRMPNDLVEALNQEVERLKALDPASKANRSTVIRGLLQDYFADKEK